MYGWGKSFLGSGNSEYKDVWQICVGVVRNSKEGDVAAARVERIGVGECQRGNTDQIIESLIDHCKNFSFYSG